MHHGKSEPCRRNQSFGPSFKLNQRPLFLMCIYTEHACYFFAADVSTAFGFQFWIFFFQDDLWASLSYASSKPVAAVMDTWTKQMGFPVLYVTA